MIWKKLGGQLHTSTLFFKTASILLIQMSHWRHTMLDGAKLWISCEWLAFLNISGRSQMIQNSAPSTIVWCQCDIRIGSNNPQNSQQKSVPDLNVLTVAF